MVRISLFLTAFVNADQNSLKPGCFVALIEEADLLNARVAFWGLLLFVQPQKTPTSKNKHIFCTYNYL